VDAVAYPLPFSIIDVEAIIYLSAMSLVAQTVFGYSTTLLFSCSIWYQESAITKLSVHTPPLRSYSQLRRKKRRPLDTSTRT
jgi:hypothetical protein